MMKPMRQLGVKLTTEELKTLAMSLFSYDPTTGLLLHKKDWGRARKGCAITSKDSKGYTRVSIKGRRYLAHRIIWLLEYDVLPNSDIDHVDGVRTNNKLMNLRLVSRSENLRRQLKRQGLSSKYKGVSKTNYGWVSQIGSIPRFYLGTYDLEEEAALAYNNKAEVLFGKYARFNIVFEDQSEGVLSGET